MLMLVIRPQTVLLCHLHFLDHQQSEIGNLRLPKLSAGMQEGNKNVSSIEDSI